MNEIMKCIMERRAIRKYKAEQISDDELNSVLQAGMYAPSAGGRQGVFFLVMQNTELNENLGKINKSFFNGRVSDKKVYVSTEQPSIADDPTISSAFYGAPTVITIFGVKNFLYCESDCSVAAQNIMLAAHSFGLGSCMIGRAAETFETEYGKKILEKHGVDDKYIPTYHILVGYPDCEKPKARERKERRIIRIN